MPSTADPTARDEVTWGLGDAAVGFLLALVGGQLAGSVVLLLSGHEPDEFDQLSLGWALLAQVGLWVGLLGVPWVVSRLKGRGLVADFGLRAQPRDALVGGLSGALTQLLLIPLLYLPLFWLTDLDPEDLSERAEDLTERASGPFGVVMLILIVGVGAPIFEEIFWRGLVLRSLERRLGTWPAVGIGGLAFGLAHFQWLEIPALSVFGVVAGFLTVRTGRLGPAIAAHVVFNMAAVVTLLSAS
jgi:membrane protease YdiL (CAAX protease family)